MNAASGAVIVRALRLKLRGLGAIVVFCLGVSCLVIEWPSLGRRHELAQMLEKALLCLGDSRTAWTVDRHSAGASSG